MDQKLEVLSATDSCARFIIFLFHCTLSPIYESPLITWLVSSIIDGNKIKYKANEIISEYEYISQKNGIKENIVLSSKPSNLLILSLL
mgnify:CR=1 FL=1